MHKHQAIADKYAGEACKVYTLNGVKDGIISGRCEQFATIRTMEGAAYQFGWPVVARKMEGDKTFYTC